MANEKPFTCCFASCQGFRLAQSQFVSLTVVFFYDFFFFKFKLIRFHLSHTSHFYLGFGAFKNYICASSQSNCSPNTDSCTSMLNLWVRDKNTRDILVLLVRRTVRVSHVASSAYLSEPDDTTLYTLHVTCVVRSK